MNLSDAGDRLEGTGFILRTYVHGERTGICRHRNAELRTFAILHYAETGAHISGPTYFITSSSRKK